MTNAAILLDQGRFITLPWGVTTALTALAASMAVNTLMTGLIVFKILKVFLEVKATSIDRTLGSLSSNLAGGIKLRHIIFIIVESGMALFAIQLARVVLTSLVDVNSAVPAGIIIAFDFVADVHEMLNVIFVSFLLPSLLFR